MQALMRDVVVAACMFRGSRSLRGASATHGRANRLVNCFAR